MNLRVNLVAGGGSKKPAAGKQTEPRPPAFSDDEIALRFADKHGVDMRYVAISNEWRRWDETRWSSEKTLLSYDLARKICRDAGTDCDDEKVRKALSSASTISNVERLARSDRRHAAVPNQFDADPWLLNTPDGVIHLKSGEMLPHRREFYQTKITSVGPGGKCELWLEFLRRVTDGDDDLQRFLARIVGYALTGVVREHAFFFLFGLGGNGKSVFTETCRGLLGDYSMPAPMAMFTATKFQAHTTDIAGLQGSRLVLASETEAGHFLAEAKIKNLTGGDTISARKMRSDNVSFSPQFKLMLSGNRKPHLRSNSEAMRRRMHLVPFEVTIPDAEKDPQLPERLREEWPGILAWAMEGCSEWQRCRLAPPARVRDATTEYLSSQDSIGEWMAWAVIREAGARSTSDELFASYRTFIESRGEDAGNLKDFVADLEERSCIKKRTNEGYRWQGVRLLETAANTKE